MVTFDALKAIKEKQVNFFIDRYENNTTCRRKKASDGC